MQTTQRLPQEDSLNTVQQIQRVSKVDSAEGNQVETIYYGTVNDDQIWATSPDLNLFYAGAGNDHLHGSAGRDIMQADNGDDILEGGAGNDQLWGGKGNDQIWGGQGNDILNGGDGNDQLWGGKGNDLLRGGAGNDLLIGMDGDDILQGGRGNDFLAGEKGNDSLLGGAGKDTFNWAYFEPHTPSSNDVDIVHDFTLGEDKLEFSRLLSPGGRDLQLSIRQIGSAGELEVHNSQAQLVQTIVLKNTDLLSVRDEQGALIGTLSSQEALQRMMDMGALDYHL